MMPACGPADQLVAAESDQVGSRLDRLAGPGLSGQPGGLDAEPRSIGVEQA